MPTPRPPRPSTTAHPRAGGENSSTKPTPCTRRGSSPRGRGKPRARARGHACARLIPARAGKTGRVSVLREGEGAHPRAGGENRPSTAMVEVSPGSSPRGRGKLRWRAQFRVGSRLIPARAGKTRPPPTRPPLRYGSSPRGRGKRAPWSDRAHAWRLIPARAGKTRHAIGDPAHERAHPRAGGENFAP